MGEYLEYINDNCMAPAMDNSCLTEQQLRRIAEGRCSFSRSRGVCYHSASAVAAAVRKCRRRPYRRSRGSAKADHVFEHIIPARGKVALTQS